MNGGTSLLCIEASSTKGRAPRERLCWCHLSLTAETGYVLSIEVRTQVPNRLPAFLEYRLTLFDGFVQRQKGLLRTTRHQIAGRLKPEPPPRHCIHRYAKRSACRAALRLLERSAEKCVNKLFLYHLNLRVSVGRRRHQDQFPMIFLPNSRASTDHAPGPIIANVAPKVASVSDIQRLAAPVTTIHNSTAATSAPATGVHNPTRMNKPRIAPVISGITRPAVGVCSRTIPL
jgi:hypothetical protein